MVVLISGGFGLADVARNFERDGAVDRSWRAVGRQFEHTQWHGCTFWDLVQPAFMFMVGVAVPFSYASRRAKGDSPRRIVARAVYRSALLIALGVFLFTEGRGSRHINWTFTNVLAQMGLGYTFLYFVVHRAAKVQIISAAVILIAWWVAFAAYALPPQGFDRRPLELPRNMPWFEGLAAHWNVGTNLAASFDRWFLNLFARPDGRPFTVRSDGYTTLNFIPSLATMVLGVMAGSLILRPNVSQRQKLQMLLLIGVACMAAGAVADLNILPWIDAVPMLCPIVKPICSPSFILWSTGWCFLMLAGFYGVVEIAGYRRWTLPLVVVGMNSIFVYLVSTLATGWLRHLLNVYIGRSWFEGTYGPLVQSIGVLLLMWAMCCWLYRRGIFLRI